MLRVMAKRFGNVIVCGDRLSRPEERLQKVSEQTGRTASQKASNARERSLDSVLQAGDKR